ncbi:MAG TPA: hypothetical protein DHV62_06680 [Elusimicrobia bacterium]|nr:hypothetical protein [Elusimicrobiota bacterium]
MCIRDRSKCVVTIEENIIIGGIGSIISEVLTDNNRNISLKRIAIPDEHCFNTGEREYLQTLYKLDTNSVVRTILEWLPR